MPVNPTQAQTWFYQKFYSSLAEFQLIRGSAEGWSRFRVWNGETMVQVLPKDFDGNLTDEHVEMLYENMQQGKLFYFELGKANPRQVNEAGSREVKFNIAMPVKPEQPQPEPPNTELTAAQTQAYNMAMFYYNSNLRSYNELQGILNQFPGIQQVVENYNAGRDMAMEGNLYKERYANHSSRKKQLMLDRADSVITDIMGPRPKVRNEVFYTEGVNNHDHVLTFDTYNNDLEPNGYDLPEGDNKLDYYDAATINFAMLGVKSEMVKMLVALPDFGPIHAAGASKESFGTLLTGLFSNTRHGQNFEEAGCLGRALQLGKEAVMAYLEQGDPTLLGNRLAESMRNLQESLTGTTQTRFSEDFVAGFPLVERVLGLLDRNEEIRNATGLQENELDFMRGYVRMGHFYCDYNRSAMKLTDANIYGKTLSTDEKAQILADVVLRQLLENRLKAESKEVEQSDAYQAGFREALAKDAEAEAAFSQWKIDINLDEKEQDEIYALESQYKVEHDLGKHTTYYPVQFMEHDIIKKLAKPGLLEQLRENLLKDPAILAEASKDPMEITPEELNNGKKLSALVEKTTAVLTNTVDVSDRQRRQWFENMKAAVTAGQDGQISPWLNPNVAGDANRLMIGVPNARGGKDIVSVASLVEGGLNAVANPNEKVLELMYRNALDGNLYYYNVGKDLPVRLSANAEQTAVENLLLPPGKPSVWQRFANAITGGRAYPQFINPVPDRDPLVVEWALSARETRAAAIPEEVANHNPQPQEEIGEQVRGEREQLERAGSVPENEQDEPNVENQKMTFKYALEAHDPTNINNFLNWLPYKENQVPPTKNIGVNGEKMGVLVAMIQGSADLSYKQRVKQPKEEKKEGVENQNDQPNEVKNDEPAVKKDDFVRIYNDPDKNYQTLVGGRLIHGMGLSKELNPFVESGYLNVRRALTASDNGDYSKLGKILAHGLIHNNKALQAQKKLDDAFTAYAVLGAKALEMIESYPQVKEEVLKELGGDTTQLDIAKAAKNISDFRLDFLPEYNEMLNQYHLTTKKVVEKADGTVDVNERVDVVGHTEDVAKLALLCQLEVSMNFGKLDLADFTKFANPEYLDKSVQAIAKTFVVNNFMVDVKRIDKIQNPAQMKELAEAANEENLRRYEMKQNGKAKVNEIENKGQEKEQEQKIPANS